MKFVIICFSPHYHYFLSDSSLLLSTLPSKSSMYSSPNVRDQISHLYKYKGKAVPVHHVMEIYGGSGGIAPRILDLGTGWRLGVSFTPRPLYPPGERASGTHWIGGWMGPGVVLDAVVKRKIPSLRWESNPRTPIVQPVSRRYTDWAIAALHTPFQNKR
jgi:hypothetical protein